MSNKSSEKKKASQDEYARKYRKKLSERLKNDPEFRAEKNAKRRAWNRESGHSKGGAGFIYAFRNPDFPKLIKVGMVKNEARLAKRLGELNGSTPKRWEEIDTVKVRDAADMEAELQDEWAKYRKFSTKELFEITPETVKKRFAQLRTEKGESPQTPE